MAKSRFLMFVCIYCDGEGDEGVIRVGRLQACGNFVHMYRYE
jgi:hypothetical protein